MHELLKTAAVLITEWLECINTLSTSFVFSITRGFTGAKTSIIFHFSGLILTDMTIGYEGRISIELIEVGGIV